MDLSPQEQDTNEDNPQFKTPGKHVLSYAASPRRNNASSTPRSKGFLKYNQVYNPFENASLDTLHLPTFSPSVFLKGTSTPSNHEKVNYGSDKCIAKNA